MTNRKVIAVLVVAGVVSLALMLYYHASDEELIERIIASNSGKAWWIDSRPTEDQLVGRGKAVLPAINQAITDERTPDKAKLRLASCLLRIDAREAVSFLAQSAYKTRGMQSVIRGFPSPQDEPLLLSLLPQSVKEQRYLILQMLLWAGTDRTRDIIIKRVQEGDEAIVDGPESLLWCFVAMHTCTAYPHPLCEPTIERFRQSKDRCTAEYMRNRDHPQTSSTRPADQRDQSG